MHTMRSCAVEPRCGAQIDSRAVAERTMDVSLNGAEDPVHSSCQGGARYDRWHVRGEKPTKAHSVHSMAVHTFLRG